MRVLLSAPAIESLVDDKHTDGVASVEECAGARVMAGADEVETSILHQAYLANLCGIECHRTKNSVIVMHTGTVDEYGLTIEHKTFHGIERERADAVFRGELRAGLFLVVLPSCP